MIDIAGTQATIRDIRMHGDTLCDIHDLAALYYVKQQLEREQETKKASAAVRSSGVTREAAEKWVSKMQNEDTAKPSGGKWTLEQVRPYAQKHGIATEGSKLYEFYAIMNAMYSDYSEVAKKYNAATPDFFAEMAKAFMLDKDAVDHKTAVYYDCIVRK